MTQPTPNPTRPGTRSTLRPRVTLLLVVAAFVLPILYAWWMARVQSPADASHLVNHGTFIRPPVDIHSDVALAALASVPLAPSEWAIVYYAPGECATDCAAAIETLQILRSLLGQATTRVRVAAVIESLVEDLPATYVVADAAVREGLAAAVARRIDDAANASAGVVFLDWRGQIMMHFPDVSAPADIQKDLRRLLRASQIK